MQLFNLRSIKGKLNVLMAISSAIALLIACSAFIANDVATMRLAKVEQITTLAEVIASNSTAALSFDQADAANDLLASLVDLSTIKQACLYDAENNFFASYQRDDSLILASKLRDKVGYEFTGDGFLELTIPVVEDDEQLGHLYLQADMSDLKKQVANQIVVAILVMVLALVIALAITSRLQKIISTPILDLATTTQKIADRADFSLRVEPKSQDEIGVLYERFNHMLDRIQDGEHKLRQAYDDLELRVEERTEQLSAANERLKQEMNERQQMNGRMIELSHQAGKAEVATGVLHNVGNVLNSINVSASLVEETLRHSRVPSLQKTTDLMLSQDDLGQFITEDSRGKMLPDYLSQLAAKLIAERDQEAAELRSLIEHLDHVKTIVSMQQSYAGVSGLLEAVSLPKLIEDAKMLNASSLEKHSVEIVREFEPLPELMVEKQKLIQILVNLLQNAKDALTEGRGECRKLLIRIYRHGEDRVRISLTDNGVGIAKDNLTNIFSHGFTTKETGHGFGLHSCANAVNEMGGMLTASSDGIGAGATFTIEIPFQPVEALV